MKNLIICVLLITAVLSSVAYSQDDIVYTATGEGGGNTPLATGEGGGNNPGESIDNENKEVRVVCIKTIYDTVACQTLEID